MEKTLFQMTAAEIISTVQPSHPKPKPRWTPERTAWLLSMSREGICIKLIARKLRVTPGAASAQLYRVTTKRKIENSSKGALSKHFWRKEGRTERFIEMWNSGHSSGVIAAEFKVSRFSVTSKVRNLREAGVFMRRAQTSPSAVTLTIPKPESDAGLIEKWNAGYSANVIGVETGKSRSAVIGKVKRIRDSGVFMRSSPPLVCVGYKARKAAA